MILSTMPCIDTANVLSTLNKIKHTAFNYNFKGSHTLSFKPGYLKNY